MRQAILYSTLLIAAVSSCSSANSGDARRSSEGGRLAISHSASRSEPPPATPPNFCTGAADLDSVRNIVLTGPAVVAVEASVVGDPTTDADNDRLVSLANVVVEAGDTTAGPITQIHETDTPSDNQLPPGDYFLLIGANTSLDPPYYLVDGLQGSFIVTDGMARQRCPNYEDPSNPVLSDVTVPLDELIDNVDQVISQTANAESTGSASSSADAPATTSGKPTGESS